MSDKKPHSSQTEVSEGSVSRRRFLVWAAGVTASVSVSGVTDGCGSPTEVGEEFVESGGGEGQRRAKEFGKEVWSSESKEASDRSEEPVGERDASPSAGESSRVGDEEKEGSVSDSLPEVPGADAEVDWSEAPPSESPVVTFDPNQFAEDRGLFSLGVASGAMQPEQVMLWTFLDKPTQARVRVWQEGPQPGTVRMIHDRSVNSNTDGYLKLTVNGFQPATWYQFAFFQGQKRSAVGRFRTAFAAGSKMPLTIGAATCTRNNLSPFESLQMLAKEPIDMWVHLGDMSYNDSAKDLAAYRKLWKSQIRAGGYKELLPHAGMYMTWDDHEIDNNWNPEKFEKKRLQAAKQAFFETLPVERGANDRLWRSYQWGNTAEFFVLDCRSERKPSTRSSKSAVYLSAAQMSWLKDRLKKSTAHFKVLLNSVPMTNMPAIWASTSDRWEGYKAQRQELLNHIENETIKNVWFLSGDFHVGFVGKVETQGYHKKTWEVAVGPSDSLPNPLGLLLPSSQFPYHSVNTRVMTTLTFDPKSDEVRIRFVDANQKILFDKIFVSST